MIIRLTTKLGRKISVAPSMVLPADPNPFADWTAHLFYADRAQYIMITNTFSLYSMVMPGTGITTGSMFLHKVTNYMFDILHDDGLRFLFDRLISPAMVHISFSKTLNRSVTGSMNDLVHQAKAYLINDYISPLDVSFKLNDMPLSYIQYDSPREVFTKLKFEQGPSGEKL